MKQLKQFILAALVGTVAVNSTAQTVITGGFCGKQGANLTWYLYSDSVLRIYGSGDMDNYNMWSKLPPWTDLSNWYQLKIKTIIIGDSVTHIGNSAFGDCGNLISATIGNSVVTIGCSAFSYCTSLSTLTIHAETPPVLCSYLFTEAPYITHVYVPCGSVSDYLIPVGWNKFSNYIEKLADTTFIFDTVCYGTAYNSNGFNISEGVGVYYDTLQNIHGCDSIICLYLAEYPEIPITSYSSNICQGGVYSDDNFVNLTLTGIYYDTLQNVNNCDSIIELTLIIDSTYTTQISDSICIGKLYDFFGKLLTTSGIYYDTLQTIHSCDSIIELTLTVTSVGIVEITDPDLQITGYEIYDVLGKLLLSQQSLLSIQSGLLHFVSNDVEDVFLQLPAGFYFIKLQTNKGIITKKLIKNQQNIIVTK